MGCGSCGVVSGGTKTGGCQSNGCSTGGCNKFNVFDWLADMPLSDFGKPFQICEISFNNGSRKEFFINSKNLDLIKGSYITVEGVNGYDVGIVSLTGELVKLQLKKYNVKEQDVTKKILRHSHDNDIQALQNNKTKEAQLLVEARAIARSLNLEMKIGEVELQADGKKLTIFYTANSRVDFRDLIKIYAQNFGARIEMKQIGARQESGKVGGIGSCGRELCCSTWLTDFKTVYTSNARYQNLSINQTKLSGQCGKLKCCLNYELDTYMDALTEFPNHADVLEVKAGKMRLVKKDIFKKLMWYSLENSNKQYPLTLERVAGILDANKKKIYPDEIEPAEVVKTNFSSEERTVDAGFVNDVGQITLKSLAHSKKKNSKPKSKGTRPPVTGNSGQAPDKTGTERRKTDNNRKDNRQQKGSSTPSAKPQNNNQKNNRVEGDKPIKKAHPKKPRPNKPKNPQNN